MSKFIVEVDPSTFNEWVEITKSNVHGIVGALENIEVIIWQHTIHRVPVRLGYLEQSFFENTKINTNYPLMELKITMTGERNPTSDWDYALYMHEGRSDGKPFNYTVKGELKYLQSGFFEAEPYFMRELEKDYLSALGV